MQKLLINRNIPYDIRHRQFDNQNSKAQKHDIPPIQKFNNKIQNS